MNWIIHKSKIKYHGYLDDILASLSWEIKKYNWILSDLEIWSNIEDFPVNMEQEYFILKSDDFQKILDAHVQFYWGVILAVPIGIEIKLNENNLPYVEGNHLIWKNGNLQYPDAVMEIDCFDTTYTIVKFATEELSQKFRACFPEAIELEKLN